MMALQTGCAETDAFFRPLKEHVIAATGLSYYCKRDKELAEHVGHRLRATHIQDCQSYLRLLQSGRTGREELDHLIEALTIGETYFFRHPQLFAALEQRILPDVIERNKHHRRLRIWSAGASIGAEAYSVSILLRRDLAHLVRDWDVTIIGTDINRSFLARAAKADYEDWALRGVSGEVTQRCFSRHGKHWGLRPEFQAGVSFQYHNLVEHPFPSMLNNLFAFDVILCRNVMIYFGERTIEQIVSNMRRCLVDDGWLLVGHAEHALSRFRAFRSVALPGATAYQRSDAECERTVRLPEPIAAPAVAEDATSLSSTSSGCLCAPRRRRLPFSGVSQPSVTPPADLAEIRLLADRGEIERAASRCDELLQTNKLHPDLYLYRGQLLQQLGQHAECEQALRCAIYLNRKFVLAHYYLGLTLQRLGRRDEAVRSLRNTRRLLAELSPNIVLEDSDGLSAMQLDEMSRMQLDALEC